MNEKNVAIVDAAFIRPTLKEPLERSQELLTILRQQGHKLVFLGNETSYAGADYQTSMAQLGFSMNDDDQFMSGATLLAKSAKKTLDEAKAFLFENGNDALAQEFSRVGIEARSDLESNPEEQCRVYIGNLITFTHEDTVKLLKKLDRPSTDLLMAFGSQRISDQRDPTHMLMNSLRGTTGVSRDKIWSGGEMHHFDLAHATNLKRSEAERPNQHISTVTFDAEIYATVHEVRQKCAHSTDALFYIEPPQALHDTNVINKFVYGKDTVPNLDAVIQKLQKM